MQPKLRLLLMTLPVIFFSFVTTSVFGQVIQTDKPDYVPGEYVVITGSEWMPGETVTLKIVSDCGCTNVTYNATANANGEIYNKDFLIKEAHLGAWFTVTAYGTSSGLQSITYFTDASFVSKSSGDWNSPSTWIKTLQGTISVNNNSTLVTGVATSFTTEVSIGDVLYATTGLIGTVASIANNTSLTLSSNNSGPKSGVGYGREGVPTSSDNVTINGGHSVVVTSDASCSTLIVNATSHATPLVINSNVELSVSGSVNFLQSSNNQSTISVGSGTLSAGSISLAGGGGNRIAEISVGTGTVIVNGNLSFSGTSTNARFTFANAGTLKIAGALGLAGTINNGSGTIGTIEYNGLGAQSILAIPYNNLTTSGSGTKTLSGATTVNGVCTIGSSTTLDISSRTMTMPSGSSIQVNGILDFSDASGVLQSGTSGTTTLTIGSAGTIKTLDAAGLGPAPNTAPLPSIVTQTGGSWNAASIANSGTVEYYRSSAQTVTDLNYNNLVFTNAGAKSWTPAAARSVNGNLTLNTNASLTIASGTIDIRGNLTNDGSFTLGSSTIILDGNAVQSINGGNATSFNNLTINNSNGVTINQTVFVNGVLKLTNGVVTVSSGIFRINTSGSITDASPASYVDGVLQQVYSTTGSKTFPIGKGGNYRPVTLNYTSLTGTSTVDASQLESGFTGTFPLGTSQLGTRFWTVRQVGASAFTYNITLDASGFSSTGDVKILKFNAPSTNAILSATGTAPYYTASGLSSFSDFALGHVTNTAPVVTTPQAETTNEDVAKTITPSVIDAENDPLAFEIVTNPTHGSVVVNGDGTFTYTPASNYYGPDAFTYKAKDDKNEYSDVATVDLTIASVNDAPSGANKTVTTNEDVDYTFTTSDFGFADVDGNSLLAVKLTTLPAAGNLTLNSSNVTVAGTSIAVADITAGNLKFHPGANANGTGYTSFTFQVQDNGGTANSGANLDPSAKTMTIDVTAVNDAPTLSNLPKASEKEDIPVSFTSTDFSDQFADVDGNSLAKIKITSLGTHGTVKLSGVAVALDQEILLANIANLSFVPNANYHGAASFGWNGSDGTAYATSAASVNITLASVNDAPAGDNNTVTTLEDNDYIFKPSDFGFTDPNDDPANAFSAVKLASLPLTGSLSLNGSVISSIVNPISYADINAGNFKFHPASNGNGMNYASFTFQVKDDGGTANDGADLDPSANSMQINVTPVSDAPAGTNGSVSATEDQDYVFTLADFGFTDPNDNPANNFNAVTITTLPLNGTLTLSGSSVSAGASITASDISSGHLKFRAASNANGNNYASFTFQVQDDGSTDNGGAILDPAAKTITINVAAVNDAPTVSNVSKSGTEDVTVTFSSNDFTSHYSDIENTALASVKITSLPLHGTLKLNNVPVALDQVVPASDLASLTLVPENNYNGDISFGWNGSDGSLYAASAATVTITLAAVNDAPTVANAVSDVTVNEDAANTVINLTNTFADVDGDNLAISITNNTNTALVTAGYNSVTKQLTLQYAGNKHGTATITLEASDGALTVQDQFLVTVNSVNDAPAGGNKTVSTLEDIPYTFTASDFSFADPDDNPANSLYSVKISTLATAGTLKLNGTAVNQNDYIPVGDIDAGNFKFYPALNANGSAYANFKFKVQDNGGTANDGVDLDPTANTITIDVTAVNDAPTVSNVSKPGTEDVTITFALSDFTSKFSDVDGDQLNKIKITSLPAHGTLKLGAANVNVDQEILSTSITNLTFVPELNYNGNTSFGWNGYDGTVYASTGALVNISLQAVNDAPNVANAISDIIVDEDAANTIINLTNTFADVDGDALTVTVNNNSNTSLLTANYDATTKNLTLHYNANKNGSAIITIRASDGSLYVDDQFNVTVHSVNDEPSGADNIVTISEDGNYPFAAADFGFTDANDAPSANSLLAVKITTLPGAGTLKNNGANVSAGTFVSAADITAGKLVFAPAANANGTPYASFTFQVQDDGGVAYYGANTDQTANNFTINVTPVNDAPVVSITNAALSVQYSDPIAATTITATDVDNSYSDLKISSSYVLGSTTYPGLPTGLSLTAATGSGNTQTWSLTGNMMVAPGKYTITFKVCDQTPNAANNSGTTSIEVTVGKEDAKIEYTGLQFVSTPSIDICKAKVVLRASVVDATAFATTDAKYDASEGDVSNMTVTFKVYTQGGTTPIKIYTDVPVTYVDPSNKKIGIASKEHEFTISNCTTGYDIFDVEVCPGTGFYQADKDKDNVTVSKPMNDFITGGGNILATQAAGKLAQNYPLLPQETGKMNFGFNVKWNKTYKNPQGNMNIIIRRNGKIFQVKANQMTSLTVGGAACSRTGTFIGSANIADVTNDVAQSIPGIKGGGLSLEVTMTDNYLTGTKDLVGMSLWDGSTLIYSSNWSGTKTVEKVLNGGNLEAHNGMVCTSALITSSAPVRESGQPTALADAPEGLSVTAYPNPSTNRFTVKLQSNDHVQSLKLVVYDVNGKVVETRQSLVAGQTVQLGALYRPGVYIIEMVQGTQHKQVKLVKIPD